MRPGQVDDLTRDAARDAAREELSRKEYDDAQPSLVVRLVGWLLRELAELFAEATARAPGGRGGVLVLLALAGLALAAVLVRLGSPSRRSRTPGLFADEQPRTAADYRLRAERAAADDRFADAVRERLRAVARDLEERGVVDARPGRTAAELARDAGAAAPRLVGPLLRGAHTFEEIWYGGRPANAASYAVLVEVDQIASGSERVST
ncbi:MAG TPA: DUF4129 domain-containing protein [Mycobacteriales bacterium]|nr:DUF4129 domain-containing protein [Mycobacteriales bacterium]